LERLEEFFDRGNIFFFAVEYFWLDGASFGNFSKLFDGGEQEGQL